MSQACAVRPTLHLPLLSFVTLILPAMIRQWANLRAWEGSRRRLSRSCAANSRVPRKISDGFTFTRKAAPDAGIECFWTKSDGEEWAWQAKLFFQMQEVQWRVLDESDPKSTSETPLGLHDISSVSRLTLLTPASITRRPRRNSYLQRMRGISAPKSGSNGPTLLEEMSSLSYGVIIRFGDGSRRMSIEVASYSGLTSSGLVRNGYASASKRRTKTQACGTCRPFTCRLMWSAPSKP